jgi:L-ascorbate 6-phosphate lactonase
VNGILEELCAPGDGLRLCWLGNLSWLAHAHGQLIAFDLDIDEANPDRMDERVSESPVRSSDLAPYLNVQFVTHKHGDHFSMVSSAVLAKESSCLFVVPANCVDKAHRMGIPDDRLVVARPGESVLADKVCAHVQRAHHGAITPDDCGYVVEFAGMRLYQPGDTVLLDDHLELKDIDVLFVSPTTHNMHIDDSVQLVQALGPSHVFAQHFGTYVESEPNSFWTRGYPEQLGAALPEDMRLRYTIPEMGRVYRLEQERG